MSYLLAQILVCLLIAGLIGAIIGWLFRGGCSRKIKECEDEWKLKMGALESEYKDRQKDITTKNTNKDQKIDLEQARLKSDSETKYGLKDNKNSTNNSHQNDKSDNKTQEVKDHLLKSGVILDDKKIATYAVHGVDFKNDKHLEDSYDIQTIEGIGPKYATIFKTLGINTTEDLVHRLKGKDDDIRKFAQELKVQPEDIQSWISMAELISLPGVNAQFAELMQSAGVTSISHLSKTDANSLYDAMKNLNEKTSIAPEVPSTRWVKIWTKISKALS